MEELIKKKEEIKKKIYEYQECIFKLEEEIININKECLLFSDKIILNTMKLSNQQEAIINSKDDNILVIASPGSGKTHTLISRYISMVINDIIKPEETLLITFTKKSGMEMQNRLEKFLPNKLPFHVGSLHGLCYKILNEYSNNNSTLLDEKDSSEIIKELSSNIPIFIKNKINNIIDQVSTKYPLDLKQCLKKNNIDKYYKEINNIIKTYQQKKKKENLIDFNDLMVQFCKFLDEDKSNDFKNRIKYVFFDEYQDINPIQNYILLKLFDKSKFMVIGDDAQSIYSFRGSSVNFILDLNKSDKQKTYFLEENYRSTSSIVNFCENIISNNLEQIKKNVISKNNIGIKPQIYSFTTQYSQYKWIVNDILKKVESGVKLSDIVILARKNNLLDNIELELLNNKINVSKNIGLSLLDKPYIKDFLAWLIILINPKSTIHWKRIISLQKGYDIKKANLLLDSNNNIWEAIQKEPLLNEFYNNMVYIKTLKKDIEKAKYIISCLEKTWENDEYKKDINNLLKYFKGLSIEQFISDLHLNQDIDTNFDNVLYLSTIHGAKGLEWDYVYIIDMNSKDFSYIRPKYYKDELNEVDEERRLFYVAASRAKNYLHITYHDEISPLLREINPELYLSCGKKIEEFSPSYIISKDIQNYIKMIGYKSISSFLSKIETNISNVYKGIEDKCISNLQYSLIGKFMNLLISKMMQINFPNKIKKFDRYKHFPKNIYQQYIDTQTDWRNILEHIFLLASYEESIDKSRLDIYKNFLINDTMKNHFIDLEKGFCKLINSIKPKYIYCNYMISVGSIIGEIDILCDNIVIQIKTSNFEIATVSNISQILLYTYLLKKKETNINKILLFNPLNGVLNTFNIDNIDITEFKKKIY